MPKMIVKESWYYYYNILFEPLFALEPGYKTIEVDYDGCTIHLTYNYKSKKWSEYYNCSSINYN